ncbi:MAG: TlpA disulfide reductase family protein [Cyclobacteriaceae bacterium]
MKNKTFSALLFLSALTISSSLNALLAQSVITGTLLGNDGKPMKKAMVLMTVGEAAATTVIIQPDKNGQFRRESKHTGLHFLNFAGADHVQQQAVIYIEEPRALELNVRLDQPDYKEDLSLAEIYSNSAKASFNGQRLQKLPNGKFGAVFHSNESSIQYLIRNATNSGMPVTGTNAKEYFFSAHGGIHTAIFAVEKPVDGKVTIELDPVRSGKSSHVKSLFPDEGSIDEQLTQIYHEINSLNYSMPSEPAAKLLSNRILMEESAVLRQALWVKYLALLFPGLGKDYGEMPTGQIKDSTLISKAMDELSPTSPFWMLRMHYPSPADYIEKAVLATGHPERYKEYIERSVESWPFTARGWGYSSLISMAEKKGDSEESDRLYERLKLLSPESQAAKFVKLQRERKEAATVVAGSEVPSFKAHSLQDTSVVYTPDNMQTKIYLIDFWATWCAPCIQEFPYLQRAYEQYHDKGFQILSYSLDASREVVVRFRKERFPMPWLHGIDLKLQRNQSPMAKQFEVFDIPAAFLIDESGKILATSQDVSKEKLEEVLKKLFEEK